MSELTWERVYLAERLIFGISPGELQKAIQCVEKNKGSFDPIVRGVIQEILTAGMFPEAIEVASKISEKRFRNRAISSIALKYFELILAGSSVLGPEARRLKVSQAFIKAQEGLRQICDERVRRAALHRLQPLVHTFYANSPRE